MLIITISTPHHIREIEIDDDNAVIFIERRKDGTYYDSQVIDIKQPPR